MKTFDIPQAGKRGITVSQGGRYAQISRTLSIPTNLRTPAQVNVRTIFSTQASRLGQPHGSPARRLECRRHHRPPICICVQAPLRSANVARSTSTALPTTGRTSASRGFQAMHIGRA
jgi:hypothetical protein